MKASSAPSSGHDAPRHLLELFPGATVVVMLRHPRATIESLLATFKPAIVAGAGTPLGHEALRQKYAQHAQRWRSIVNELLHIACDYGDRVVTVRIEDAAAGRATLAAALDVRLPDDHPVVNAAPHPTDADPKIRDALAALWSSWRPRLAGTMLRAGYPDGDGA